MGHGKQPYAQHDTPSRPPKPDLRAIIQGSDVMSAQVMVEAAKEWGTYLANGGQGLTSSQIRGIFGQVRQIEMNWPIDTDNPQLAQAAERALILLKPKLAYQAQRDQEKNKAGWVRQLEEILVPAIDLVESDRGNFQHFVDYFEAILAYHRAAGGK